MEIHHFEISTSEEIKSATFLYKSTPDRRSQLARGGAVTPVSPIAAAQPQS